MKKKRNIYIIILIAIAVIIYWLFFRKKKPSELNKGDLSIDFSNGNVDVFSCKRKFLSYREVGIPIDFRLPEQAEKFAEQFPIKYGDCGIQIADVQSELIKLGYLKQGTNDGKFGRNTEKALNEFYKKKGLPMTGKFTYNQFDHLAVNKELI